MYTFTNPGQFFGPAEALAVYKNIPVDTPDGIVTVSINNYRNLDHSEETGGCARALLVKDALAGAVPSAVNRAGGGQAYMDVFSGKGSPQGISAVMETFVDSADAFCKRNASADKRSQVGKCAGWLADSTISWKDTLQRICDDWIGLDCNGFTGNWLRLTAPEFKIGPNTRPNDMKAKAVTYRKSLEEIEYWDIMCYCHGEHVAAVNWAYAERPGVFDVCQSAGGGPRENDYGFIQLTDKTFRLAAPTSKDIGTTFYVVSLW
jgi:hypothetical protein